MDDLDTILATPARHAELASATFHGFSALDYALHVLCDDELFEAVAIAMAECAAAAPGGAAALGAALLAVAEDSDDERSARLAACLVARCGVDPLVHTTVSVALSRGDWSVGGRTALHLAAAKGNTAVIAALLDAAGPAAAPALLAATDDAAATPWLLAAIGAAGSVWSEAGKVRRAAAAALLDAAAPLPTPDAADALASAHKAEARARAASASLARRDSLRAAVERQGARATVLILPASGVGKPWEEMWYGACARALALQFPDVSVSLLWDGVPSLDPAVEAVLPSRSAAVTATAELVAAQAGLAAGAGVDVVIGHSAGGSVALALAQLVPIGAVVALAPGFTPDDQDADDDDGLVLDLDWAAVARNTGAVVLVHSEDDPVVDAAQSRHVAHALGAAAALTVVPGEEHWLSSDVPACALDAAAAAL